MDISERFSQLPASARSSLPPRPRSASPASSISSAGKDRLHITAEGREGRRLRKALAIALGLRKASSCSSASNSQSEGEDQSYSLLELMKRTRHTRMTTGKMQLPDLGQLLASTSGTRTTRRVTRKSRTVTRTRNGLGDSEEEEDNGEGDLLRNAQKRESTKSMNTRENSQTNSTAIRNETNVNKVEEEIFASLGESNESAVVPAFSNEGSSGAAARLLRAKPPTTRARGKSKIPTARALPQQTSRELSSEMKLRDKKRSGRSNDLTDATRGRQDDLIRPSNAIGVESAPVYEDAFDWQLNDHVSKSQEFFSSSDTAIAEKNLDTIHKEKTQKSQIPRLMKTQKTGVRLRDLLSTVTSDGNEKQINTTNTTERDKKQPQASNFSMNLGKLLRRSTKETVAIKQSSDNMDFDYDSLERELAKLKRTMFDTLEDFQDMKKETFRLTEEVRNIRVAKSEICK